MRKTLIPGAVLTLGGVEYRIEGIEGSGSSAVVYQASYEDGLNAGSRHRVFIKELLPVTADGSITRDSSGQIRVAPEGETLMACYRERFLLGNRVHLSLLGQSPGGIAGNVNSFAAYGTCYSILSLHGGENLLSRIQKEGRLTMVEAVSVIKRVLSALELFHGNGLLHLDLSPDNILLLPEQALLIDYNSVWDLKQGNWENFSFSEKEGYCAPEVKTRNTAQIGYATDLFSLCAIFFQLVTGRILSQQDLVGRGLHRHFSGDMAQLWEIPQTAAAKAVQILMKGLHTLPRKRYGSTLELMVDLQELENRIFLRGITPAALWESSHGALLSHKPQSGGYLSRSLRLSAGERICQEELTMALSRGECFLLTGAGGMGKTRLMMELWRSSAWNYDPRKSIVLYLSLRDYQHFGEGPAFIRQGILRGLRLSGEQPGYADALHQLERLLDSRKGEGAPGILLLLDGLNEAGSHLEPLLQEIEILSRNQGLGILLTDRSDGVLTYALEGFRSMALEPLTRQQVEASLPATVEMPEETLVELLSNPMMLELYIQTGATDTPDGKLPQTPDDLIRLYLDAFCRRALRADSGDESRQLCTRYLLEHLLPELALKMTGSRSSLLTLEAVSDLVRKSYDNLRDEVFENAFPEYKGRSRTMLRGIDSPSEWFDFAIRENLIDGFGLLEQTPNGNYCLLHDNFQKPLSTMGEENHRKIKAQRTAMARSRWRRGLPVLAAVLLAVSILAGFFWQSRDQGYTEEEVYHINDATNCLILSLAKWNEQISAQSLILSEADSTDILSLRDPGELADLNELILKKDAALDAIQVIPMEQPLYEALVDIQSKKVLFSPDALQALCLRQETQEEAFSSCMEHIRRRLCDDEGAYIPVGRQEAMLKAYEGYLDSEIRYVSYELALILTRMPQEQSDKIHRALADMNAFRDFSVGPGSLSEDRLQGAMDGVKRDLEEARNALRMEGFSIGE